MRHEAVDIFVNTLGNQRKIKNSQTEQDSPSINTDTVSISSFTLFERISNLKVLKSAQSILAMKLGTYLKYK